MIAHDQHFLPHIYIWQGGSKVYSSGPKVGHSPIERKSQISVVGCQEVNGLRLEYPENIPLFLP